MLQFILPAISMLGGLFGGKSAKSSAQQQAGGATMQHLMPIMMKLIEQQHAQSGQNYQQQQQRYQANLPMQDALRAMAMRMMPNNGTQGLSMPPPISQQPMPTAPPPLAPLQAPVTGRPLFRDVKRDAMLKKQGGR